jgi:hypothetical protein
MTRSVFYPIILSMALFFMACSGEEKSTEEKNDKAPADVVETDTTTTDTLTVNPVVPEPVVDVFSEDQLKMLGKYLDEQMISKLEAYHVKFHGVATEQEFLVLLDSNYAIRYELMEKIRNSKAYKKISNANYEEAVFGLMDEFKEWKELPGMSVSCVAECTESDIAIKADELLVQAKATSGEADNTYMQLFVDAYGWNGGAFAAWFNQTWDYGGSSLLGSGIHLKFFKRIDEALTKSDLFAAKYKPMRRDLIDDILNWRTYMKTEPEINKELQQILDEVQLSDEEKEKIKARMEAFKALDANELHLDCENGDCPYG